MDLLESLAAELIRALEADPSRDARIARVIDQYEVVGFLERRRKRVLAEVSDRADRIPRTVSLHRSRGARHTTLGAPAFDHALELVAPDAWALAVFKQSTRSLVQVMIERWGAVVESGRIKLHYAGAGAVPDAEVLRTIRGAMDLARSISIEPDRIPDALAKNALEDPEPGLRERSVLVLVSDYPERAHDTCLRALQDPEPEVRLAAVTGLIRHAIASGTIEGDDLIWADADLPQIEAASAELVTDWGVPLHIREEALLCFMSVTSNPTPVLERTLADPVLAMRAVAFTGRFQDPSWPELLVEVFDDCDPDLRSCIAAALAGIGHPKAESLLLTLPLNPYSIAWLAEIGTARAIPLLRKAATKEARAAIARILERVGPLEGHLGLVEAEDRAGALSEADAGRVSLASPSSTGPSSSTSPPGSKPEPEKPT